MEELQDTAVSEKQAKSLGIIMEYIELFVISVLAVLIIFSFGIRICTVKGDSMKETLHNGERLITTNLFYTPQNGDIIVFQETEVHDEPLVKRVIATGGQHLEIDFLAQTVKIDGKVVQENYIYLSGGNYKNKKPIDMVIPDGYVFVMGDNRNNSDDSRNTHIGLIPESHIIGKVILRISPFTKLD